LSWFFFSEVGSRPFISPVGSPFHHIKFYSFYQGVMAMKYKKKVKFDVMVCREEKEGKTHGKK